MNRRSRQKMTAQPAISGPDYYTNPQTIGSRMRIARLRKFLLPLIEQVHARNGSVRILDLGGAGNYWMPIMPDIERLSCSVTVMNLVISGAVKGDARNIEFVEGDACVTSYSDLSFDLVHSNSMIEHVGSWSNMVAAAGEIRRLAPSYYVQVPYFWFPLEPHFRVLGFQWLPENVRARMLMSRARGFYSKAADMDEAMRAVQTVYLLDRRQMQALFPDAEFKSERLLGLTKSLIAIRA